MTSAVHGLPYGAGARGLLGAGGGVTPGMGGMGGGMLSPLVSPTGPGVAGVGAAGGAATAAAAALDPSRPAASGVHGTGLLHAARAGEWVCRLLHAGSGRKTRLR